MLASLLHVLRGLRRIGGQCASMARLAASTTAAAPEPTALSELVEGAAALSVSAVWLARASFASRDVELAHEVARLDAELTRRSRVIARRHPGRLHRGVRRRHRAAPRRLRNRLLVAAGLHRLPVDT